MSNTNRYLTTMTGDSSIYPSEDSPAVPRRHGVAQELLSYDQKLDARAVADVDLVILHCTELPDLEAAREYAERIRYDSGTGNSGHFYLDRSGVTYQYVSVERVAHHTYGYNTRSVGIEIVNFGRYPNWQRSDGQEVHEAYPQEQIDGLISLLHWLPTQLPALKFISGHEDLDTRWIESIDDPDVLIPRKMDPGPLFPWEWVLGRTPLTRIWADLDESNPRYSRSSRS